VVLQPFDATGTQMIVVSAAQPGAFYTLGARTWSTYDPITIQWEGVGVYLVNHDCGQFGFNGLCPGIWREHLQEPPNPNGVAHALQSGGSITLKGIEINVTARTGTGFAVTVGDPNDSLLFIDIATSTFVDDIVWLAHQSITTGCNPPASTSSAQRGRSRESRWRQPA
jgi:hypothetical protein